MYYFMRSNSEVFLNHINNCFNDYYNYKINSNFHYNIQKNSEIPDIGYLSPVCQVLGVRPGNICKIFRSSRTSINSEYYRICKINN